MANIWNDGRSGAAGCAAGNLALQDVSELDGPVQKIKGTVFETRTEILIGRVCGNDAYLSNPTLHWANAIWDQHIEMCDLAKSTGKSLKYLLVTATETAVNYWNVAADVVQEIFEKRGRNSRGSTCAIHVLADGTRHFLGSRDVTEVHHTITITGANTATGTKLRPKSKRTAAAGTFSKHGANHSDRFDAAALSTFSVPVSGGRNVTLILPAALSANDIARVKSWFDLTADVLTEPHRGTNIDREKQWLREQVETGLNDISRGEVVNGEDAFAMLLNRRRKEQATPDE